LNAMCIASTDLMLMFVLADIGYLSAP